MTTTSFAASLKGMRRLLVLCLFAALLSTSAPSAGAPPAAPPVGVFFEDFCADPVKAVCGTLLTNPIGREALLLQVAKAAAAQALADIGGTPPAQLPPAAQAQALGRYQERLLLRLRERTSQVEWNAVQRSVNRVRALLLSAIDRAYGPSRSMAQALQGVLHEVRVLDSSTLRQILSEGRDENAPALARAYARSCGWEGLGQNAFAASFTRTRGGAAVVDRYFIVCPGLLLSAIGAGADARSNLENLLFVVGHELSHHFDAEKMPTFYEPYQRCLEGLFGRVLPGPLAPRMGEISADFWGTEVLLGYLNESGQGPKSGPTGQRERLWSLRQGVGALCGSQDDGVHPSGAFRIGSLLRHHPGIITSMRCMHPGARPTCTLRGPMTVLIHPERLRNPQ